MEADMFAVANDGWGQRTSLVDFLVGSTGLEPVAPAL